MKFINCCGNLYSFSLNRKSNKRGFPETPNRETIRSQVSREHVEFIVVQGNKNRKYL